MEAIETILSQGQEYGPLEMVENWKADESIATININLNIFLCCIGGIVLLGSGIVIGVYIAEHKKANQQKIRQ